MLVLALMLGVLLFLWWACDLFASTSESNRGAGATAKPWVAAAAAATAAAATAVAPAFEWRQQEDRRNKHKRGGGDKLQRPRNAYTGLLPEDEDVVSETMYWAGMD